ncbi:MAG: hypothetical protein ABFR32_06105 [Bacteroidota bacterium]
MKKVFLIVLLVLVSCSDKKDVSNDKLILLIEDYERKVIDVKSIDYIKEIHPIDRIPKLQALIEVEIGSIEMNIDDLYHSDMVKELVNNPGLSADDVRKKFVEREIKKSIEIKGLSELIDKSKNDSTTILAEIYRVKYVVGNDIFIKDYLVRNDTIINSDTK